MFFTTEKELAFFRAIGFLDGISATVQDPVLRTALCDALEQLENAAAEDKPND